MQPEPAAALPAGGDDVAGGVPAGPEEPGGDGGARPLAAPRPAQAVVADPDDGDAGGLFGSGWEIPPIRMGGNLGYTTQRGFMDSASGFNHALFGNISASSFIIAPGVATVTGRLGITQNRTEISAPDQPLGAASVGSGTGAATTVLGGGELNLLGATRFPSRFYYDRSDSRTSGYLVANQYTLTQYGARQAYASRDGETNAAFDLSRNVAAFANGDTSWSSNLNGSLVNRWGPVRNSWALTSYTSGSDSTRLLAGEAAQLNYTSNHFVDLGENANLGSTVQYSQNKFESFASANQPARLTRSNSWSVNTFGSWLPEFEDLDDLPLSLNASVRAFGFNVESGGAASDVTGLSATLGANYRFNQNATAFGSVQAAAANSGASGNSMLSNYSVGAVYTGDPLSFGNYSYNWSANGNANWSVVDSGSQSGSGNAAFYSAALSHQLGRNWVLDRGDNLYASINQSLTVLEDNVFGVTSTLNNGLSASYGMTGAGGLSLGLFGSAYYNITTGAFPLNYTSVNLGANGGGQLSQHSSFNVNMTMTYVDQEVPATTSFFAGAGGGQTNVTTTGSGSKQTTIVGNASYNNSRFLMSGVRYNSIFTIDTRLIDSRLQGQLAVNQSPVRWQWGNYWYYRLGKLDFTLNASLAEVGGAKNALLYFSVTRSFGNW
ncbi:MAG: hypothetical protein FIB06_11335 [Betaproteobacteria bacterium]|nr:hypothetical protein [Betaproteobacteria bacterium]